MDKTREIKLNKKQGLTIGACKLSLSIVHRSLDAIPDVLEGVPSGVVCVARFPALAPDEFLRTVLTRRRPGTVAAAAKLDVGHGSSQAGLLWIQKEAQAHKHSGGSGGQYTEQSYERGWIDVQKKKRENRRGVHLAARVKSPVRISFWARARRAFAKGLLLTLDVLVFAFNASGALFRLAYGLKTCNWCC